MEIEAAQITARLEKLPLETTIAEKRAQVQVLSQFEEVDGMNEYANTVAPCSGQTEEHVKSPVNLPVTRATTLPRRPRPQPPLPASTRPREAVRASTAQPSDETSENNILRVMNKQNEITEMLVKQTQLYQLPVKEVTVFKGDPLTFKSFIRAFEQTIEAKTDDESDKLYYLLQYTAGEPQELVRSCEHMPPRKAYKEAKGLLEKHFGDELIIASAYMEKALQWPSIRAEHGKAMSTYALFLTRCKNTMEDVEYLEEMDNPTNMRIVVSKLPFKIRETWWNTAYNIKEQRGRRARFADLVNFIDHQAKITTDPLFGNLQDKNVTPKVEKYKDTVKHVKSGVKGSSFATQVTVERTQYVAPKQVNASTVRVPFTAVTAFEPPCHYCQNNHALESCRKIQQLAHKGRIDFLRNKGLCFGCLTPGHMIKTCKKRIQCKTCSLKHPQILHIEKDNPKDPKEGGVCPPHSVPHQTVGFTAAGASECLLSIIPVKVRSQKSGMCVETYAFIDPGSTGTFCTEELQKKLDAKGKPTQIVLNTMGQDKEKGQKLFKSVMLTDVEVSGLDESAYIQLPKVFTHSTIPVQQENIPKPHHLKSWPYLAEVYLPEINADVGLLISANNPKTMEPWHVVNSQQNGPFAVKTVLGWMVCGAADNSSVHYKVNQISLTEIEQLLVQQYNTDFPEKHCDDKAEMSQEDKQFMQSVQKTAKCVDGHYSIGLPFKQETVKMPNNRCVAEQRAASLKNKLKKKPVFLEDYKAFMKSLFEKGYAEEIPPEQLLRDDHRIWYIPHHGVYHPKKKKIRVVFDCTASYKGVSLNEELLQGPDLTNTLIGVLQRFREEPVAMMADIESMFTK